VNRPVRILIIDDNPDDRLLAIRALRREFPTLEAVEIIDERSFTAALEDSRFDATLTDFRLRWANGLDLLHALKARYPNRPVIMFTSTGTEEVAVEAMKAGLDDYVVKTPHHFMRLPIALRTALERAEAGRRTARLERRLDLLLNTLRVGVFRMTLEGQLLDGNAAFVRLLGYGSLEEAQADAVQVLYGSGQDRARLIKELQPSTPLEREVQVRRRNGSVIWLAVSEVLHTSNGDTIIAGLLEDITERKWAEQELYVRARQQAAVATLGRRALAIPDLARLMDEIVALVAKTLDVEYCRVMELLPEGDLLLLRAGVGWQDGYVGHTTVAANTDSQVGYTLVVGGPVIVEDLRTETRFHPPPLLEVHGVVSSMSVIIHRPDASGAQPFGVLSVETTKRRMFTEDDIYFLQAVANVLTAAIERKASEEQLALERAQAEQLAELDRLRRDFIASVSHDLRTPITAAGTGLGLLEISLVERLPADERRLLENVKRNLERLRLLIDDLLTYNQLEAGILRLERELLDLRMVATEALAALHPLIQHKGQTVVVDLPTPLVTEGDRWRLGHVLVNLLANAHEHTPPGTHITIAGCQAADEVVVTVRDTGPGIPAEALEVIFQRFQRLDSVHGGSGLGLAIAKGIVELHGGRIWVESQVGAGASFSIALPHALNGGE
jgi:PAS domain S-box-containing protein